MYFRDERAIKNTDLFQGGLGGAKLSDFSKILRQNSIGKGVILSGRLYNAQFRFLNNRPSVFNDFGLCEATQTTMSDPKLNEKQNAQARINFGKYF